MKNILYLDDYINLYNKDIDQIIKHKPYKNTLKNGHIIDEEKFIKVMNKILKENNLNNNIFNNDLTVIINHTYSKLEKETLITILEELNYKKIKFIQEIEVLKINKDNVMLNYNLEYFQMYYVDLSSKVEVITMKNIEVNKKCLIFLLKLLNKRTIYIYGKNVEEICSLLNKNKLKYYTYEENENLLIKIILSKIM